MSIETLTEVWGSRVFGVFEHNPPHGEEIPRKLIACEIPCTAELWRDVRSIAGELGEELAAEAIARLAGDELLEVLRAGLREHHPKAYQIRVLTKEDRGLRPNLVYVVKLRFYLE